MGIFQQYHKNAQAHNNGEGGHFITSHEEP